jgi:hypothetical protein
MNIQQKLNELEDNYSKESLVYQEVYSELVPKEIKEYQNE